MEALALSPQELHDFKIFAAGYKAAKEKYDRPEPGQLTHITNEIDAFLVWRQERWDS